jgi:hypothetical protein
MTDVALDTQQKEGGVHACADVMGERQYCLHGKLTSDRCHCYNQVDVLTCTHGYDDGKLRRPSPSAAGCALQKTHLNVAC